ncbi:hypothetical protein D3C71_1638720 [compost metagenome]
MVTPSAWPICPSMFLVCCALENTDSSCATPLKVCMAVTGIRIMMKTPYSASAGSTSPHRSGAGGIRLIIQAETASARKPVTKYLRGLGQRGSRRETVSQVRTPAESPIA